MSLPRDNFGWQRVPDANECSLLVLLWAEATNKAKLSPVQPNAFGVVLDRVAQSMSSFHSIILQIILNEGASNITDRINQHVIRARHINEGALLGAMEEMLSTNLAALRGISKDIRLTIQTDITMIATRVGEYLEI